MLKIVKRSIFCYLLPDFLDSILAIIKKKKEIVMP